MKTLVASLRRLAVEHRLQSFAIVPNTPEHPETHDPSIVRDQQGALVQYPRADLMGMKLVEDQWKESGRFRIISNISDTHVDQCDCCEDRREHEFVEAILDHRESAVASSLLYHQRGQMTIWWIESERMRGYEIERLDDLVKLLVGKEGWKIEGLKYPNGAGVSSQRARAIEERFESIPEWLKAIAVRGKGKSAGVKKGRAKRQ